MTQSLGIELEPHWWEASALITALSLHLKSWNYIIFSDIAPLIKQETSEFHSRACFVIFELNLLPKLKLKWEAWWPHGQCARLRIEWSWPGTLCCVLG